MNHTLVKSLIDIYDQDYENRKDLECRIRHKNKRILINISENEIMVWVNTKLIYQSHLKNFKYYDLKLKYEEEQEEQSTPVNDWQLQH